MIRKRLDKITFRERQRKREIDKKIKRRQTQRQRDIEKKIARDCERQGQGDRQTEIERQRYR